MFCNKCGAPNPDQAVTCDRCGAALGNPYSAPATAGAGQQGPIQNYLVQSILVTVCCCLPFGIPAIVYAAQVNPKLSAGDYAGALAASNSAKMWSWVAFGLRFTVQAIYVGLVVVGGVAESMHPAK